MSTIKKKSSKKSSTAEDKTSKKIKAGTEESIEKNNASAVEGMTAEKFVDITLKIMPKVMEVMISKMEGLSKTMKDEKDQNPFEAMGKIMTVMMEAFSEFETDFQAMGASSEEINSWGDTHKEELDAYFTKNPDAQKKIDTFKKEMDNLMSGKSSAVKSNPVKSSIVKSTSKEEKGLNIEKAVDIMVKIMQKSFELMIPKWEIKVKTIKKEERGRELGRLMGETQSSSEIEVLYQSFGTTGKEFDSWMKSHGQDLQNYLEANPNLKKKVDGFKAKFDELAQK
jgi:hypothetical protein